METDFTLRKGLLLLLQAKLAGMQADNDAATILGNLPPYSGRDFEFEADRIKQVILCPEAELINLAASL